MHVLMTRIRRAVTSPFRPGTSADVIDADRPDLASSAPVARPVPAEQLTENPRFDEIALPQPRHAAWGSEAPEWARGSEQYADPHQRLADGPRPRAMSWEEVSAILGPDPEALELLAPPRPVVSATDEIEAFAAAEEVASSTRDRLLAMADEAHKRDLNALRRSQEQDARGQEGEEPPVQPKAVRKPRGPRR